MTDEQQVLKEYPKARVTLHGIYYNRFIIVDLPRNTEVDGFWGKHLSDHFDTEEEAWADAARKLEARDDTYRSVESDQ